MQFEGIIKHVSPEEQVGQNNLAKITFILEEITDREYKNSVAIDLLGEKVSLIKAFKEGDAVVAHLNFRSSEYNGRHYNRISAWKVEPGTGEAAAPAGDNSSDDLPF